MTFSDLRDGREESSNGSPKISKPSPKAHIVSYLCSSFVTTDIMFITGVIV